MVDFLDYDHELMGLVFAYHLLTHVFLSYP